MWPAVPHAFSGFPGNAAWRARHGLHTYAPEPCLPGTRLTKSKHGCNKDVLALTSIRPHWALLYMPTTEIEERWLVSDELK